MLYTILQKLFSHEPLPPIQTPTLDWRLDRQIVQYEMECMNDEMCLRWEQPYWDIDADYNGKMERQ